MKFLVGSCEQRPMLRDGTVLRSSAVTIGTSPGFKFYHRTERSILRVIPKYRFYDIAYHYIIVPNK